MTEIKFEQSQKDRFVLLCPLCGGNYLHHQLVETFERNEDDKKGIHTTITNEHVDIKYDSLHGNPSARRNGLNIKFYCEQCQEDLPMLFISQHKGQTEMAWEV